MAAVYALLVGIDDYRAPVPALSGCRNDIEDAERFLRESTTTTAELEVAKLCDARATRAAVIDAFRRHLGRAGPGDTALFWFSGHGSTAPVLEHWWHLEPAGRMQTMLCVDSRHGGVPELLDKELAILIREVADRGPHVAIVLDCCHADGATRGQPTLDQPSARIRWVPPLAVPPDVDLLLPELRAMRDATAPLLGPPDHVALAACREHQAAYEVTLAGPPRGLLSLALLTVLSRPGPAPTYRELLTRVRCYVENLIVQQVPVLYPIDQPVTDQPFLGGDVRPPVATMTMRYVNGSWEIDAGSCHGLRSGAGGENVTVAVHGSAPVREAQVVRIHPARSTVAPVGWQPDRGAQYPVVLAHVPLPPTTVAVRGPDTGAVERLAAALRSAGPGGSPSPHLRVVPAGDPRQLPELVVDASDPGTLRILGADGTPLTGGIPDGDGRGGVRAVAQLEHIARFRQIRALANPLSRLAGSVKLELVPARPYERTAPRDRPALRAGASGDVELRYRHGPEGWQEPAVFIRLRNTTDRRLYCVLLDLTDRFRIHADLLPGTFLGPGQVGAAAEGELIVLSLPPDRLVRPGAEVRDWLMLIVAEEEINSTVFALPRLGEPAPSRTRGVALATIVERLGLIATHRDAERATASARDWWTTIVPVVTRVPRPDTAATASAPPDGRPARAAQRNDA
jgi:hypothetical protein